MGEGGRRTRTLPDMASTKSENYPDTRICKVSKGEEAQLPADGGRRVSWIALTVFVSNHTERSIMNYRENNAAPYGNQIKMPLESPRADSRAI